MMVAANKISNKIPDNIKPLAYGLMILFAFPLIAAMYRIIRSLIGQTEQKVLFAKYTTKYSLDQSQVNNVLNVFNLIEPELNAAFGFISRDNDVIVKGLNMLGWDSETNALIEYYNDRTGKNLIGQLNEYFHFWNWSQVKITVRNILKA